MSLWEKGADNEVGGERRGDKMETSGWFWKKTDIIIICYCWVIKPVQGHPRCEDRWLCSHRGPAL